MADATQAILTAAVPTLAVLIGILVNNSRLGDTKKRIDDLRFLVLGNIGDLRAHMDVRFNSMDALFSEKLVRVEQVLDARLKHLEEHLG